MKLRTNQVCEPYFRIRRMTEEQQRATAATIAKTKVQTQETKGTRQRVQSREQRD